MYILYTAEGSKKDVDKGGFWWKRCITLEQMEDLISIKKDRNQIRWKRLCLMLLPQKHWHDHKTLGFMSTMHSVACLQHHQQHPVHYVSLLAWDSKLGIFLKKGKRGKKKRESKSQEVFLPCNA